VKHAIRELAAEGVNLFVVFGIGYLGGESYYPSEVAPAHPDLGDRDFLRDACEATTELGVSCIAYVNSLFGGPDAWQEHPEWLQRRTDDSLTEMGNARAMCPLSPYGKRIIAAVDEIARRYPVQGMYFDEPSFQSWCACPNCQRAFAADTGLELPRTASADETWTQFVAWRYAKVAEFVERARAAFVAHRPDAAFWCQHAFPMTSTVLPVMRKLFEGMLPQRVPETAEGWSRTLFYGQQVEQQVESLDVLSAELWRRFADRPAWWPGAASSYLRSLAGPRPVVAFLEYPDFPWSLRRIPDDELAYVVADVEAAGGHPWFPLYAPGRADMSGWTTAGRVHRAIANLLPEGAVPVAEVAVGYSPSSADLQSLGDVERDYMDGFLGAVQLLREAHVPYRIVSLDRLEADALASVQVLLLPDAINIPAKSFETIEAFVTGGGSAVVLGRLPEVAGLNLLSGVRDSGNSIQLGIAYLEWNDVASADAPGIRYPVRGRVPALTLDGAEVLGSVAHGFELFEAPPEEAETVPVVTRARHGRGTVVTSTVDVGALARRFRAPDLDRLLQRLLAAAGHTPQVVIDAPAEVAVIPWRADDAWALFLVNRTGIEEQGRAVPVGPVNVSLPGFETAAGMTVESAGADGVTVATGGGGRPTVVVPTVGAWAVLKITEER
jgi:hypothetical protein